MSGVREGQEINVVPDAPFRDDLRKNLPNHVSSEGSKKISCSS